MNKHIALDSSATDAVSKGLNALLADMHLVYGHLHALHWNVQGREFFTVHRELQSMYEEMAEFIDDTAERILILGSRPATKFSEYITLSSLEELESRGYTPEESARLVITDIEYMIGRLRELIELSGEHNDEGTADFLIGILRSLEKQHWFWNAFVA